MVHTLAWNARTEGSIPRTEGSIPNMVMCIVMYVRKFNQFLLLRVFLVYQLSNQGIFQSQTIGLRHSTAIYHSLVNQSGLISVYGQFDRIKEIN